MFLPQNIIDESSLNKVFSCFNWNLTCHSVSVNKLQVSGVIIPGFTFTTCCKCAHSVLFIQTLSGRNVPFYFPHFVVTFYFMH